ncbi:MMPL family transporter [Planotetraspora kaengkrachanensis]|uniref:Membrane protein n=1 Tax=Planotetraspora kaengkrachanensis TaxID=575193 RepID=A0A8J3M5U3_9ACTN|nr:MMPL family transporter [Planotetraspora kaengkrachanensis]GIG77700.1 membrane protein [Planotetraspora kaengkrachanensis]
MATLLYRLGRFSFRRRGRVATAWLLLLALLGLAAAVFHGPSSDEFTMPGTESQRALDALSREFPQASGATGTIVIAAAQGRKLDAAGVAPVVREASAVPGVIAALDPFRAGAVSPDGRYALVQVQFDRDVQDITDAQREAYLKAGSSAAGLRVEHGGDVMTSTPEVGGSEGIGVLIAAVVLVLTFGSLVAAGMTLLNALIGVGTGMAGLFALSGVIDLTSVTPVLALMLGMAVGIDYSLFITSRYRQFLAEGMDREEAAGRATGTAGSAVVFAGATVVIALAGLSVVGIPFLSVMGLAAAGTVAVAVVVALTLLPAFLSYAGARALPRRQRTGQSASTGGDGFGYTWGRVVTRLRVPILLAGILGLGALALPAKDLRLALPDASTAAPGSPAREAYDLTSEGFGEGFNARLVAVVTAADPQATAAAAGQAAQLIQGTGGVLAVAPPRTNAAGTTALLTIIPKTGPTDAATEDAVHAIRTKVAAITTAEIAVTGATAVGIDISAKLAEAMPVYLLLVVGLSVLLLMLVFRSILIPVKAALGFLLTVGSTFGITVAIFQQGRLANLFGVDVPGPLVSFLPILLVGILFGLAMDYQVFLVSRMREDHVRGDTPRQAVINGMGHNARVVTAAALIMTAVFGGFVFMDNAIIKSMGFALAIGVLIDAFVVRMALVPAVTSMFGRAAWWLPRPLDRALPNLDVEGERLRHHLASTTPEKALDRLSLDGGD